MNNPSDSAEALGALWRQQLVTTVTLTPAELRAENRELRSKVRRWLLVEYIACVIVIVAFIVRGILRDDGWLANVSYAAFIAGTLWVAFRLHVNLGDRGDGAAGSDLLAFQRSTLERLRTAFATSWRWYLLPFTPGFAITLVDRWFFRPIPGRTVHEDHSIILGFGLVVVLFFVGVWLWHQLVAARLQRRIDYLDTFRSAPLASDEPR
jgi:hypothetical protein